MDIPNLEPDDYRGHVIPQWVANNTASFRKPSRAKQEFSSRKYDWLISRFLPSDSGTRLLEIGCGWGTFLLALKRHGYSNIEAMDLMPECVAHVEQEFGVGATYGDLREFLRGQRRAYDVIAAFDVLEHFTKNELVPLTKTLCEWLRPGGLLIIKVPNGASLGGLNLRYSGFTHELAFTPTSLDELFRAVGFEYCETVPEPIHGRRKWRVAFRRAARFASGWLLSASTGFEVDRRLIVSNNIISVAHKK